MKHSPSRSPRAILDPPLIHAPDEVGPLRIGLGLMRRVQKRRGCRQGMTGLVAPFLLIGRCGGFFFHPPTVPHVIDGAQPHSRGLDQFSTNKKAVIRMSKFIDGPAAEVSLSLQRSPMLLRVVRAADGAWDALDQIIDAPEPGETVFVYQRVTEPVMYHFSGRDKQGRRTGGFRSTADYRFLPDQPAAGDVRTNGAWQAWCQANGTRIFGTDTPVDSASQIEGEANRR